MLQVIDKNINRIYIFIIYSACSFSLFILLIAFTVCKRGCLNGSSDVFIFVGFQFYAMVVTISTRSIKGPSDCITCKPIYTII